ncbi:MAG: hypothetical protein QOJ72_1714 [Nocardioidaceae bacterium]|nr:hypothetical protein [Nocardioidaceae bacterium]
MTTSGKIHIDGPVDAQVDLLDRQIVTDDGYQLAKADDLELEELRGRLHLSGFLIGPGALGPRLGGALQYVTVNTWSRLARRDVDDPRRIDYTHVSDISTVIRIDEGRESAEIDGLETWTRERIIEALPGSGRDPRSPLASAAASALEERTTDRPLRRLSQLTGMRIRFADGSAGDRVTDARMSRGPVRGHLPELVIDGFVVGRGRPGMRFGYDRDELRGPWLLRKIIGHRSHYLPWSDIVEIDWDERVIQISTDHLEPLRSA